MHPFAQLRVLTALGAVALSLSAAAQSAPATGTANGTATTGTAGTVNTAGQAAPIVRSSGHKVIVPVPREQQDTATPRPTFTR